MLKILGWALAGLLLFLFVLLLLPVRTRVRFDGSLQVWAGLGPISLRIFPMKKKPKSEKEKAQAAEKKAAKKARKEAKKAAKPKKEKPKQKLTLEIICDYIRLGAEALGMLRRRLVLSNLTCHLKVASKDAAGTALLYGRIAAAISAGASAPWTRTGSKRTFANGYRLFKILSISWIAAPAELVIIPMTPGYFGNVFLCAGSKDIGNCFV